MAGKRSYSESYSSSCSSASSGRGHKKTKKGRSSNSSASPKDRKKNKEAGKDKHKDESDPKEKAREHDIAKTKDRDEVQKKGSPKRKSGETIEKVSKESKEITKDEKKDRNKEKGKEKERENEKGKKKAKEKEKERSKGKSEKEKPKAKESHKEVFNKDVREEAANRKEEVPSEVFEPAVPPVDTTREPAEIANLSEKVDDPNEPVEKKLRRDIASLQEMLDERVKQQQEAKENAQVQDLEADIEILRGLVRERELELLKEIAQQKQQTVTEEREHLKQVLLECEMQKQKEEDERELQKQREIKEKEKEQELEKEKLLLAERQRREMEALEPYTLPPPDVDAPCELPIWCVIPSRRDIIQDVELVRLSAGSNALLKKVWFGKRSWVLFGRRQPGVVTGPKADIGLAAARSSRSHAIVMRNWLGQIFLQDLGSPNGTFMDKQKLKPYSAVEWKIGSVVYFAEPTPEVFEIRLWKKS